MFNKAKTKTRNVLTCTETAISEHKYNSDYRSVTEPPQSRPKNNMMQSSLWPGFTGH